MARNAASAVVVALAFVVLGAGCSSPTDRRDEAIEEKLGGDVDYESNGGGYTLTEKDGDSIDHRDGAVYPAGWPADVEVPDTVTIVGSTVLTDGGNELLRVNGEAKAPFGSVVDGLKQQLEAAGYTIGDTRLGGGNVPWAEMNATGPGFEAFLSLSTDSNRSLVTVRFELSPTTS